MKSPDNVLLGIALFLLSGVILYNVFMTEPSAVAVQENDGTTALVTVTEPAVVPGTTAPAVTESLININTATAEELETLKGIGPAKAEAIVAYREQNGPFSSVDDLVNVTGIGEKTLANIRDKITV
ncbi:MAG: helix-hairpin-helix domain-containing protein [Clostridia bacterium]|nr:helix-hairpin-helix domain-containing protein [Clostridia bacterium]MBQ3898138.1 helix-hairpin-helix domain-containing protein [Clostridia bacterium]